MLSSALTLIPKALQHHMQATIRQFQMSLRT